MGKDKLSLCELNKDTLVYSQVEEQGPPGKPLSTIIIIKAMKSKSERQFPTLRQNWHPPCSNTRYVYRHTLFYCALRILHFLFFCGNPALSKSVGTICSIHGSVPFGNSCNISNFLLLYLLW